MSIYRIFITNIKNLLPFFICLLLTIISVMPIMPLGYESITPLLGVVAMAFWIVHRPDLMNWFFVIIIGFLSDILYGSILGSSILAAIIIRLVLTKIIHKLEPTNFYHSLLYVTLSLIIWLTIVIMINYILNMQSINLFNNIFQCLISIIISPIVIFFQLYVFKKSN